MSKIHFLQVRFGDSFVIECDKGGNHGVVVVDGGPSGGGKILDAKLKELGVIPDLMVLTHYDADHIAGLSQYVTKCTLNVPAKETWANCIGWPLVEVSESGPVATRSLAQAVDLARTLKDRVELGMGWKSSVYEGHKQEFPFASIEVVSPLEDVMKIAIEKQVEESQKKKMMRSAARPKEVADLQKPLEELALEEPEGPHVNVESELANASSIGFILRCDDLSILMLGDCYPHNAEAYLRAQGYSEENPLVVDYVKVSHHGSRHNTRNSFLDIIRCNHFIISTNGEQFGHPDRACIAHILCHPHRNLQETVHIYLDYPMDTLVEKRGGPFLNEGELEKWNAVVHDNVKEIIPEVAVAAPVSMAVTIHELKKLNASQASDLLSLMKELNAEIPVTRAMLANAAKASKTHLFVALDGKRIVGCASLCVFESPTGRKASVEDVVVTSAFRGQGIGRALMEHVIDYARRELLPVDLHLTSSPWRTEANELYQSLGFIQRDTNMYRLSLEVD